MIELRLQKYTKIYPLTSCNFKKQCSPKLIYAEDIENGYIVKEYYYADEEQTELVITVDIEYIFGSDNLVSKMNYLVNYYTEPESGEESVIGLTVPQVKKLTPRQKLTLLKKRRKTVRLFCEAQVLQFLFEALPDLSPLEVMNLGGQFILTHKTALDYYEAVGSPLFVQELTSAEDSWLDFQPALLQGISIRQYLISQFN